MIINPTRTIDDVQAVMGTMPAADLPIALFPVRLETRFTKAGATSYLCVRIFPDDVHIDGHEQELTEDEERWGRHAWEQAWRSGGDAARERAIWEELASRFGHGRAAWIVHTLTPLNADSRPGPLPGSVDPGQAPSFPSVARRAASWTKAPVVRLLPDRWVVVGYRGSTRVLTAYGDTILTVPPFAAAPDPTAALPATRSDDRLTIDSGVKWLVDFEEAVRRGMGLRIPLASAAEVTAGYDRLIVFGITTQRDAVAGAAEVETLLASQNFTDGLAFVPQGTPSNNTAEAPSGYAAGDPQRWTPLMSGADTETPAPDSNAVVTARALGIASAAFERIPHAGDQEQADARHLNTALWPAMCGYFLRHVVKGALTDDDLERARRHFSDHVRARGPLPVLRVGRQPYGILPVVSLNTYVPAAGDAFGGRGIAALRTLRDWWRRSSARVPQVQPAPTPEVMAQTLADVLGMQATASHIETRLALDGELYGAAQRPGLTSTASSLLSTRKNAAMTTLKALGVTAEVPGALMLFSEPGYRLADFLVGSAGRNGSSPTDVIAAIRAATFKALQAEQLEIGAASQTPLYLLLRHAMLLAYAEAAYRIQRRAGSLTVPFPEPGLVDVHSQGTTATAFVSGPPERTLTPLRLLEAAVPSLGAEPLHDIVHELGAADHPDASILDDMRESLDHLATVPAPALDGLLRETLDLASHRLDAWMTSLATVRLRQLRQRKLTGLILGGYGWVENLRAGAAAPVVTPEPAGEAISGDPLYDAGGNGGYVVAPSLTHASAAAILRAGYLAYGNGGEASAPFAIDLSSDRVRLAQWLLDGVRQGQPLRALLGYRFERALRDNNLAKYIRAFRLIAPFGALYEAKAEKTDLERQQADIAAKRVALVNAVNAAQTALNQATSDLNAKTALVSQLANEINTLAGKITTQQKTVTNSTKDRDFWQSEVTRLSSRPPTDERRMEAQAELTAASNALKAAQTTLTNLQTQKDQKSSQHFTAVSNVTGLTTTRNTRQTELNTRKSELTAHDEQNAGTLATLAQRVAELQTRIAALETEYKERFTDATPLPSMETIEAQHVVDGLELMRRWKAGEIRFAIGKTAVGGLPLQGSGDAKALARQLDALAATVDAVSDLVTAESVFQLAQGNELRAGATLDAIARGETPPPEPAVVQTPRSGIAHTHRTMVILGKGAIAAAWPSGPFGQRALAEPALNAWVAGLLPDPARVRIDAAYVDPHSGEVVATRVWRLGEFSMAPLDFVYLAPPDGAAPGSALEAVMTYAAIRSRPAGVAANARVRFTYESGAGWAADEVDLGACVEAARAVRELLVSARPLDARDLALPEAASERRVETAEMRQRADGLVTALRSAALNLERLAVGSAPETIDLDALRHALERLSWIGMPQALPRLAAGLSPEDRDGLLEQAAAAMEDAARTLAALDAAEASIGRATASADAQCDLDVKRIQIVLGADFRVLPRFQADDAARTGAAFAGSATLQGFTPLAAVEWVQQMAHVREGVARLATCLSYAEALAAAARMRFVVGQQPFDAKDRWVALPRDPQRPEGGARISMVAHDTGFDVSGALSGFMVDEWVETIPSAKETVGVAFHYDAPNSQPPHAVLLAVPPDERPRWDMAAIEAVILETLDLAKLRSVDPAALADDPDYGNLLPALYVAVNPAGDTISTDLSRAAAL